MSWGLAEAGWGLTPWGDGDSTYLYFTNAYAVADRVVRVFLSKEPRHVSVLAAGDALNPRSWTVLDLGTGKPMTTLAVRPGPLFLVWDIYLLQKFQRFGNEYRIKSDNLRDGLGALINTPKQFDFQGCKEEIPAPKASATMFDIANPPFDGSDGMGGTLTVGSSGDYNLEAGLVLLKKLIIRRLSTAPGAFFHLTDYGVGIQVKVPLSIPDLVSLKAEVQRQIAREPEVDAAQVSLRMREDGTLIVAVKAKLTGQQQAISTTLEIPPAKIVL